MLRTYHYLVDEIEVFSFYHTFLFYEITIVNYNVSFSTLFKVVKMKVFWKEK